MLRCRGGAGPSPPAAGHTPLQTRAHGSAGGPAADLTQVWSECPGLGRAFPRALQVLTFSGSKASGPRLKKPLQAAKLAPGFTPLCTISPVGGEVLLFSFMGMGWVTLAFPWYLNSTSESS